MKSPSFNLVGFVLVLVLPGTISAQQPTAYIPNSPTSGPETALCTPPPGSTCSVPSQTSYVLLFRMPSLCLLQSLILHQLNNNTTLLAHLACLPPSLSFPSLCHSCTLLLSAIILVPTTHLHLARVRSLRRRAHERAVLPCGTGLELGTYCAERVVCWECECGHCRGWGAVEGSCEGAGGGFAEGF
jgi:hypothetical protein